MLVDEEKCTGCGICVPYCPAQAISLVDDKAVIDQEKCLECGTCGRQYVVKCPTQALYESPQIYKGSRAVRKFFSDPMTTHPITRIPGRGTEEVKTNDVTGRVGRGEIGIGVELGRPCLGTSLAEVEKVTMALAKLGIDFEERNPLTHLMSDRNQGIFRDDIREERVVSAIVEFTARENWLPSIIETLRRVAKEINTVFSLDLIAPFDDQGNIPILKVLEELGMMPQPNAKVNLGLGRPLKEV